MAHHNPEIDRLRAIAVLITMFAHFDYVLLGASRWYDEVQPHWNGSIGVYIFFVISGYLISGALVPDLASGQDVKAVLLRFWTRRFARIVPLAVVWIAIPLVLSVVFNTKGLFQSFEINLPAALASVFFVFNGYLSLGAPTGIYSPYWSLSLEEQFYLLFPAFLLALPSTVARLVGVGAAALLVTLIPPAFGPFRADGLIFGVALYLLTKDAELRPKRKPVPMVVGLVVTSALLVALVLSFSLLQRLQLGAFLQQGFASIAFVLVYLATLQRGFILPLGAWGNKVFDWIGTRSFGIYLIHMPAYMTAGELTQRVEAIDSLLARFCIGMVLLIVATELSYRFIETPARRWGRSVNFLTLAGQVPVGVKP